MAVKVQDTKILVNTGPDCWIILNVLFSVCVCVLEYLFSRSLGVFLTQFLKRWHLMCCFFNGMCFFSVATGCHCFRLIRLNRRILCLVREKLLWLSSPCSSPIHYTNSPSCSCCQVPRWILHISDMHSNVSTCVARSNCIMAQLQKGSQAVEVWQNALHLYAFAEGVLASIMQADASCPLKPKSNVPH